ncbi:hypothetical protein SAMD00019534_003480 [Acytostelium subglobosum LB1]|uniref:hypothetical protein n=1 Tax=Acytostelium subglobosum LB1 TaxID=1410327 RepID=UPI0006447D77|nr:hypothetical protein SAMD00019534_003480 [Acytostelium subglobosum LB1]GAM17173.1 hypothetical protein SAMD00019534_003480 [Acytostelium subglobosum LB1]|eukprot:XP_012759235.1 hypothetical protein SAMD00019534_003480 [Acytostelium subglobosum LB1]
MNKVYELRTYSISLENWNNFIALTQDHIHLRTKHSKLCGYWMSELGGINEVVHLWEYSSLDDRAKVRYNLRFDKEWNEKYMVNMKPYVLKQDNIVLREFNWCPLSMSPNQLESNNVWELSSFSIKPGNVGKWSDAISKGIDTRKKHSLPNGMFYSEIGKLNTVFQLWSYNNFEERTNIVEAALKDSKWSQAVDDSLLVTTSMDNKILVPVHFKSKL